MPTLSVPRTTQKDEGYCIVVMNSPDSAFVVHHPQEEDSFYGEPNICKYADQHDARFAIQDHLADMYPEAMFVVCPIAFHDPKIKQVSGTGFVLMAESTHYHEILDNHGRRIYD